MSDIPQWAKERVVALTAAARNGPAGARNESWTDAEVEGWACLRAFARYIAEHEAPPVDPLDAEAERLLETFWDNPNAGSKDLALAALRRGIELAPKQ